MQRRGEPVSSRPLCRLALVLVCCLLALARIAAEEGRADGVCTGGDDGECAGLTAKLASFRSATGTVRSGIDPPWIMFSLVCVCVRVCLRARAALRVALTSPPASET